MATTTLDAENLEVLVQKDPGAMTWPQIILATALMVSLVLVCWIIAGRGEVGFLWGAAAIAVAMPIAGTVVRLAQGQAPPLAIDRNRIMVSSGWGTTAYVSWTEAECVALGHSVVGKSPIQWRVTIYRRASTPIVAYLSYFAAEEVVVLAEILRGIAELRGFEFVPGFTDAGQRRLRELPWAE